MNLKQRDNLLELADFLDQLKERNFYMPTYFRDRQGGEIFSGLRTIDSSRLQLSPEEAISCGTSACVAGWAFFKFRDIWQEDSGDSLIDEFQDHFGLSEVDTGVICQQGFEMTSTKKASQLREIVQTYHIEDYSL